MPAESATPTRATAAWRALMGPVSPAQGGATVAIAAAAAVGIGVGTGRRVGWRTGLLTAVVALDLVGGLISFQLPPTRAAYAQHSPQQRLGFVALHLQPFVLPLTRQGSWSRAAIRYGSALAATVGLELAGSRLPKRRLVANALAAGFAAVDFATDASPQRWFGPVYLAKLIGGHGGIAGQSAPS